MTFLDILAISTYKGIDQAFSINPSGGYKELVFEFGKDTQVWFSCSLQWKNNHYVFGGGQKRDWKGYWWPDYENRQVSMVSGNRLDLKATLDFKFYAGACTVLNQITIVLCFSANWSDAKVCRRSNNPLGSFSKLQNSTYGHHDTRIASFDGKKKTC